MDDIRIYNRAMSSNEAAQLYAFEADIPVITAQPQDQTVVQGGTATFSVTTTAANPLTYRWFKDGAALTGATNTTLTLTNIQPYQLGNYSVAVSNAVSGVASAKADLTVIAPANIKVQPANQNIPVGSNVTFTVVATGTTLNYQWLKDATNILDASGPELSLTNVTLTEAGGYTVVISNLLDRVTSEVAILNVGYAPAIVQSPFSAANYPGGTASFSCMVTGSPPMNLQWFFNGAPLLNQTNAALTLTNLHSSEFGNYALAATNNFGGTVSSNAELRDATVLSWTATGSLGTGRSQHTATLLGDGSVLVVGGFGNSGSLSTAELYNPISGAWIPAGTIPKARYLHTATLLPNGKVLVAAGTDGRSDTDSSAQLFDPVTKTWETTGSLNTVRYAHTSTLLPNGSVLVAGGVYRVGFLAGSELFDPVVGKWTPGGVAAIKRSYHTAILLSDNKVLVAGGYNGSLLSSAEVFDSSNGTWTASGDMRTARWYHTATLLSSGLVIVTGGSTQAAGEGFTSVELYDPSSRKWVAKDPLTTGRFHHTATLLPNGETLVVGGVNSSGSLSRAEQYDPATGSWSATVALKIARHQHTATLLLDGRVLVVGGANSSGRLVSAELFGRSKLLATVGLNDLTQTYDGTSKRVKVTTTPPGLAVDLTYNGSLDAPTNVGDYTVIGTINDLNFLGSSTNTFVILPAVSPIVLTGVAIQPNGEFQFGFTNTSGASFSVVTTTNAALSLSNWTFLGIATETPSGSGQFQFTDAQATNDPQRFYLIRSP